MYRKQIDIKEKISIERDFEDPSFSNRMWKFITCMKNYTPVNSSDSESIFRFEKPIKAPIPGGKNSSVWVDEVQFNSLATIFGYNGSSFFPTYRLAKTQKLQVGDYNVFPEANFVIVQKGARIMFLEYGLISVETENGEDGWIVDDNACPIDADN